MSTLKSALMKDKINLWIIYYISLGIIQALWINPSAFPPLPFRLIMIAGVFLPTIFNRELVLFAFPFFMILRGQLSTAYQYLPDVYSYPFYIILLLILICVHGRTLSILNIRFYFLLFCLCIYCFIIDLFAINDIGPYEIHIFIALLLSLFIRQQRDINILSVALICVCALLAIYYLIMYERFLDTWNIKEGIERSAWNDPNYFSTLLGCGFVISILYIFNECKSSLIFFNKRFLVVVSMSIFIAIVLTASRAGFLSVSIILLYSLFKSKPTLKTIVLSILGISLFCFLLYNLGVFDTLMFRLLEQGNMDTGGGRLDIWKLIIENFGIQSSVNQFLGGGYWHRAILSCGAETHNEFLAIISDYGFIGVFIYLLLVISMISIGGEKREVVNIATFYYLLCIISLSPFQFINMGFFVVWILGNKAVVSST